MFEPDFLLVLAAVLFTVAGIERAMARAIDGALVAFGLAVFAMAFYVGLA